MDLFDLQAKITLNMDNFNSGLDAASKKFNSFSDNIKGISTGIDKTYSGLKDVLSPAVDGFKAVEGVGKKTADVVKKGLTGFAAAATAVAGFGTAAVKSGIEFDATMSEVSAISGATGKDFDALRNKALEMGAKTKFSASEAAEAMTYMGMAGWKAGDMISGIEGIMNLAAASGEDLATTSDIVTDALTAFGLSASESGHFADVMAAAATNANTNVGMMGDTFKYVAPVAGALGYSVDDTAIAIGLMANSGIKATQAGTSLRSIMTRLSTNAGETKNKMGALSVLTKKLGVEFYNTDGSARDLNDVLVESRVAWSGLSEEQQISYAKTIAGQEAMSGWLALMNSSAEDVDKLTKSITECNGAAAEMSRIMVDNLQGDLTLLGSAFESLQIAISDSMTPTLREFAQFGQKAMQKLLEGFQGSGVFGFMSALSGIVTDGVTMLASKAPEFASVSVQFMEALADGLLNAADSVSGTLYNVAFEIIFAIGDWISSNSDKLIDVGKDIIFYILNGFLGATDMIAESIGKFVPLLVDGFTAYHEALFTAGVEILGAIGKGFSENKEEIQHYISITIENMVRSLKENAPAIIEGGIALLEALAGAIVENLPLIMATGAEIIAQLVSGITTSLPALGVAAALIIPYIAKIIDVVTSIGGVVKSVVGIVSGGISTVLSIGSKLMSGIQALFVLIMAHPVVAVVTAIIAAIVLLWTQCEGFRDFFIGLWNTLKEAVQAFVDFFKTVWDGVIEFFTGLWKGIAEFFSGIWEGLKEIVSSFGEWISEKMSEIVEWIKEKWQGIKEFFSEVWEGIKAAFDGVAEFFSEIFQAAAEAVQAAWTAVVDFFSGVWQGIQAVFSVAAEVLGAFFRAAVEAIQAAWSGVVEFFSGIWEGIKAVFSVVAEVLGGFFKTAWEAVKTAWSTAKEFFTELWNNIKERASEAADAIKEKLKEALEVIKSAWEAAKQFFLELWNSVKESAQNAAKAIGEAFKNAWNTLKSAWDGAVSFFQGIREKIVGVFSNIGSKFMEIGKSIVDGLKNGISNAWSSLTSSVTSKVQGIVSTVKGALGIHSPSKVFAGIGGNMALGLAEGWNDEYASIKRKIEDGMNFGTASIGLTTSSGSYGSGGNGPGNGRGGAGGGTTVNIYSPVAVDAVQVAREWQKTTQRVALGLV